MHDLFLWFWTVTLFTSIAWYFFLIFYVGAKGGAEIRRLIHSREQRRPEKEDEK
jgi:hypothetical protein